jgi:hypothetical protein
MRWVFLCRASPGERQKIMAKKLAVSIVNTRTGGSVDQKTLEAELLEKQSGRCAISNQEPGVCGKLKLAHHGSLVGGLRSKDAQKGLALLGDDVNNLKRASAYLKKVAKSKYRVTVSSTGE